MGKQVRIGLLGCGVVGGGVVEALTVNSAPLVARVGASFEVTRIAVQDLSRERGPKVNPDLVCDDWSEVVTDPNVDIVVEVIGGIEPAKSAITLALQSGKDVVTANKELMAIHGEALQALAKRLNRTLLCEGSVLGGVPAIHALHTYFVANRIGRIRGIVNGTNNYILTKMTEAGEGFVEALAQAQRLGYAEADPTMDVAGYDALYKLRILSRLAFDVEISSQVDLTGVTEVSAEDIGFAADLGCRIRHIVEARVDAETGSLSAAVGPQLVPENDPLYHIRGADNFLEVEGDIVGRIGLSGPGAGALPTASAVVEDIVKVVKGSEFRLRESRQTVAKSLKHASYVVRRRFQFGPAGNEPALAWRSDLGAAQVKYLGVKGGNAEAWYVRGCEVGALDCLRIVSSSLDGDFAVYPVSGEVVLRLASSGSRAPAAAGLALAK